MPFHKTGKKNSKGKALYRTPSGRLFTHRQIRAYKATGGFKRKPRKRH